MRKPLIAALIASAFLSLNAQAVDLLQTYQQALANDAQFASARAAMAAGQERLPQGRAGLLPVIGVGGSVSRNEIEDVRDYSSNSYTLSLSQPLFRWANWQQYEQSKLAVAGSEAQFAQAQQDLIVRVAQAYFDVLASQDSIRFVQAQKTAITEQLAAAKRNFEVGTTTITDTHEAQARYDLALAQEFAALSDLEIKRAALQQIIGNTPGALSTLNPVATISAPSPERIDNWVDSAEKQNYGVIGAQIAMESAQRDISRNRAGHYPTLDLVASRSHASQSATSTTLSNSNAIGVQWNIPLFSGFAVTSRVRESISP